ncbi:MAG: MogA/MoaB family molybdenum cofactor biosynthesis protein [Dehalococcoidia bacterium]|nr:MogA/MoaB family molybdenum cofactor biosynthesis protein [Dehalococcoidia bacterium]
MLKVGILTISDKGSRGEREDLSGAAIREMVATLGAQVIRYEIVPDEREIISRKLLDWCAERLDLILTTGGTGLGPRDVTPEATRDVVEREVPGMAEAMRLQGLQATPMAMLSRAVVGTRNMSLVVNLPGSPKGVRESLVVLLPVLTHAIEILKGEVGEHPPTREV